ncbi:MAG: glycoside hydrolase family 3 C-terminal domain-containing protein, partial [Promethearchaeota archaeon]
DLVQCIHSTGTPIVLILINGRPLSITWEKENIPAILEAWIPGEEGGAAVADVLFGDYNPGGKLPISFPRSVGQIPIFHNHKPTSNLAVWQWNYVIPIFHNHKPTSNLAVWQWNYVEANTTPLFPFGYGLSYTQFEYSNLNINKPKVDSRDHVNISFDIKNIGKVHGEEVVQLYLHDLEAIVTRPVEELFGFKRVALDPGEKAEINFTISMKQLGFYNEKMGKFEITGETVDLSNDKEFFSKVDVRKM